MAFDLKLSSTRSSKKFIYFCSKTKIVIERVVKRYLMHNQGDSDDPKLNEIDEMKQEVQTIKYEILSDIKKFREENVKRVFMLNNNLQYVTEEFIHKYKLKSCIVNANGNNNYLSTGSIIKDPDSFVLDTTDDSRNEYGSGATFMLFDVGGGLSASANSLNNNGAADQKTHKSLRKFRELCTNNKKMLKAITAFSFQDYSKLKEDNTGGVGSGSSVVSSKLMNLKSGGSVKLSRSSSEHVLDDLNGGSGSSGIGGSVGSLSGSSSVGGGVNGRNGDGSKSKSLDPVVKSNGMIMNYGEATAASLPRNNVVAVVNTVVQEEEVDMSLTEKHKMFAEFQKRLDFDIQMPYDDEW
jgi:hypothetical protein